MLYKREFAFLYTLTFSGNFYSSSAPNVEPFLPQHKVSPASTKPGNLYFNKPSSVRRNLSVDMGHQRPAADENDVNDFQPDKGYRWVRTVQCVCVSVTPTLI